MLAISKRNKNIRASEYDSYQTRDSVCEKLLVIKLENKLNVENHIVDTCNGPSRKFYILDKVAPYMNLSERCIVMMAYLNSQSSFCQLV